MTTTQEAVHTGLFGPDGKEATVEQATAVAATVELFNAFGLGVWEPNEVGGATLYTSDNHDELLTVYADGHATTSQDLPDPEPAA